MEEKFDLNMIIPDDNDFFTYEKCRLETAMRWIAFGYKVDDPNKLDLPYFTEKEGMDHYEDGTPYYPNLKPTEANYMYKMDDALKAIEEKIISGELSIYANRQDWESVSHILQKDICLNKRTGEYRLEKYGKYNQELTYYLKFFVPRDKLFTIHPEYEEEPNFESANEEESHVQLTITIDNLYDLEFGDIEFCTKEIYSVFPKNTQNINTVLHKDTYSSPYMNIIEQTIKDLNISDTNQLTKKEISNHIEKLLKDHNLVEKNGTVSIRLAKSMATISRLPESRGGIRTKKKKKNITLLFF